MMLGYYNFELSLFEVDITRKLWEINFLRHSFDSALSGAQESNFRLF